MSGLQRYELTTDLSKGLLEGGCDPPPSVFLGMSKEAGTGAIDRELDRADSVAG